MEYNQSGVYLIVFPFTKWYYVGSAVNIRKRKGRHTNDMVNNIHTRLMQNVYNKYGDPDFYIIETCEKEDLLKVEQYYIDLFKPTLNMAQIAGSTYGVKHTDDAKQKIGEANKSRKYKPLTAEHRRKIGEANKGRKRKPFTEEHRRKLSEAQKIRKFSDETRRKMSEAQKGRKHTAEAKQKIGEANKGMKHSDETRLNMSEAQKRRQKREKAQRNEPQLVIQFV